MILDFTEIPQANKGGGLQDTFELFTRDFLQLLGYRIIESPDRGADGKRDLIVDEILSGISSEVTLRWLVSCKHYASSGSSVSDSDEINISDRLKQHGCDGFMGVYSTLPATSLAGVLKGQNHSCVFDRERIESILLSNSDGLKIAARYFPESYKKYLIENPLPAKILGKIEPLQCAVCHRNLLESDVPGLYVWLSPEGSEELKYIGIACVCKGKCDETYFSRSKSIKDTGWLDIEDLKNPTLWLRNLMAFMNECREENNYSDKAYKEMKMLFITTFPYIARHLTQKEQEQVDHLMQFGNF